MTDRSQLQISDRASINKRVDEQTGQSYIVKSYPVNFKNKVHIQKVVAEEAKIARAFYGSGDEFVFGIADNENEIELSMRDMGETLDTYLSRNENSLTLNLRFQLAINFLLTLSRLHQCGYAHLDLSLHNLTVLDGQVNLIDFELSKEADKIGVDNGTLGYLPGNYQTESCLRIDLFEAIRVVGKAASYFVWHKNQQSSALDYRLYDESQVNHCLSIFTASDIKNNLYLASFVDMAYENLALADDYDADNLAIFLIFIEKGLCPLAHQLNLANTQEIKQRVIEQYLLDSNAINEVFLQQLSQTSSLCNNQNNSLILPILKPSLHNRPIIIPLSKCIAHDEKRYIKDASVLMKKPSEIFYKKQENNQGDAQIDELCQLMDKLHI
ncbi:hypothetical protein L3V82_02980 [Thiotrichales bacterium 19S3-7]|nr:hypothetical protein [Thiotrichales bacterium 19S3-7]MCF6801133.1 hypothetical protein [Thiotrichales bacterium 19S3-11]